MNRAPAGWAGLAVGAGCVAALLAGGLDTSTLPVLLGGTVTRSGMDAAGVACVGLALLGVLVPAAPGRGYPVRTADRALLVASGTWLALVLLGIVFRAAEAYGRPVSGVGVGDLSRFVAEFDAGRGLVLTAAATAAVLGCAVLRLRDPDRVELRIPLVAALLGLIVPAITGHAGSEEQHGLAVVTVAAHVGAAALWVGGLGAVLVLVRRRGLLDEAVPRFSRLAGVCLVAVTVSGVLNAVLRLRSVDALFGTGYGWLVIAKVVGLAGLAALGGLARRRLVAGRTPVLRWAGLEVALMAVTLGVAAALTQAG